MWTTTSIALLLSSFAAVLLVSLVCARRDVIDEFWLFFDPRLMRIALRSARQFRLSKLFRLVFYAAVLFAVVPRIPADPLICLGFFLVWIALILGRIAWTTLREPVPRRQQPALKFRSNRSRSVE